MNHRGNFGASYTRYFSGFQLLELPQFGKHALCAGCHNVFNLSDGHVKLLGKWFKANAIYESSVQDLPVTFAMNPLVYEMVDLAVGVVHIISSS